MTSPLYAPVEVSASVALCCAAWSDTAARRVVAEVAPEALQGPHAAIFEVLIGMAERDVPISPNSLAVEVMRSPQPNMPEVLAALAEITTLGEPDDMLGWHLDRLAEHATRVRLRALATTTAQMAEQDEPSVELLRSKLDDVQQVRTGTSPTVADLLDGHLQRLESPLNDRALPTGITDLDRLLFGGLRAGQLAIVGARPGAGKSVMLLAAARHAALRQDTTTLFVSLEMSQQEVLDRYLAAETRTDLAQLIQREVPEERWSVIARRLTDLTAGRLHLLDKPRCTVADIANEARATRAGLVVVDYLQLMGSVGRFSSRQEEVSALSRSLKLLARDLEIPVLVASQLNRGTDSRADPKPRLSDLRESGAIEQDADVVALLHRDPHDEFLGTTAELILAKNRSGPIGTVDLAFEGHYASLAGVYREAS